MNAYLMMVQVDIEIAKAECAMLIASAEGNTLVYEAYQNLIENLNYERGRIETLVRQESEGQ